MGVSFYPFQSSLYFSIFLIIEQIYLTNKAIRPEEKFYQPQQRNKNLEPPLSDNFFLAWIPFSNKPKNK